MHLADGGRVTVMNRRALGRLLGDCIVSLVEKSIAMLDLKILRQVFD